MYTLGRKSGIARNILAIIVIVVAVVVAASGATYYFFLAPKAVEPLVIITWGGPWGNATKAMGELYTQKTGVPVVLELQETSSVSLAKIRAQWPNVKADLFMGSTMVWQELLKDGKAVELKEDEIPVLKDFPNQVKNRAPDGRIASIGMYFLTNGWIYRTDLVSEPIDEIKDLFRTDLNLKGKIGWPDPLFPHGGPFIQLAWLNGSDEVKDPDLNLGFENLKKLAKTGNIGGVVHDSATAMRMLSSGDWSVAFDCCSPYYALAKGGLPVKVVKVLKDAPTMCSIDTIGILDTGQKEEAKKFMDFFLSPEINTKFSAICGNNPANPKATVQDPSIFDWELNPQEFKDKAYIPNINVWAQGEAKWNERFEKEIVPLIGG